MPVALSIVFSAPLESKGHSLVLFLPTPQDLHSLIAPRLTFCLFSVGAASPSILCAALVATVQKGC